MHLSQIKKETYEIRKLDLYNISSKHELGTWTIIDPINE